jgi:hypothetical protein
MLAQEAKLALTRRCDRGPRHGGPGIGQNLLPRLIRLDEVFTQLVK